MYSNQLCDKVAAVRISRYKGGKGSLQGLLNPGTLPPTHTLRITLPLKINIRKGFIKHFIIIISLSCHWVMLTSSSRRRTWAVN